MKAAVLLLALALAGCGGGSAAPERAINGGEFCKVRLSDDGQCPVDEIGNVVPSTGGLPRLPS